MNMRFLPASIYMAILGHNGFSINGSRRWARQFSDEYIGSRGQGVRNLSCLALINLFALGSHFRLYENGIPRYQALMQSADHPDASGTNLLRVTMRMSSATQTTARLGPAS